MTSPTQCWVVIANDRKGRPRGFEKSSGKFHLIENDAVADDLFEMRDVECTVVECVIMSREAYERLVNDERCP